MAGAPAAARATLAVAVAFAVAAAAAAAAAAGGALEGIVAAAPTCECMVRKQGLGEGEQGACTAQRQAASWAQLTSGRAFK